jgi:Predicted membrane protein (DUF2254)
MATGSRSLRAGRDARPPSARDQARPSWCNDPFVFAFVGGIRVTSASAGARPGRRRRRVPAPAGHPDRHDHEPDPTRDPRGHRRRLPPPGQRPGARGALPRPTPACCGPAGGLLRLCPGHPAGPPGRGRHPPRPGRPAGRIANKALSPAVNDPYTAIQAVHHLSVLLCALAGRRLGDWLCRDRQGTLRVAVPLPDLDEYLRRSTAQIRRFGAAEPPLTRSLIQLLRDVGTSTASQGRRAPALTICGWCWRTPSARPPSPTTCRLWSRTARPRSAPWEPTIPRYPAAEHRISAQPADPCGRPRAIRGAADTPKPIASSVAWCSTSIWPTPDRSGIASAIASGVLFRRWVEAAIGSRCPGRSQSIWAVPDLVRASCAAG